MAVFKYETHLHTAETSRCAQSSGAAFAEHYAARGYAGIFVTDHFFNGNTTVADHLCWAERVAQFCRGYEAAAARGAERGLDVFFAWEYSFGWAHFLTYGLGTAWLLAHPRLLDWDVLEYCDRVHADGGGIIHAHPFREHVDLVHLVPTKTDAVEVVNAARSAASNAHALDYAISFGLPRTAGSDIHATHQQRLCGMTLSRRLTGGRDYLDALAAGEATLFDETPA
ncbi:MAG TPA: histidinol phosphatase [Armatimonadota bacterium]|nr:histidinol phosphatase [Armatimonadota bacterium]